MTPRLTRVTVAGPELRGFPQPEPAGSIRLLLPETETLVIPEWNGNRFEYADGAHPCIRTLTPVRTDSVTGALGVEIVQHGTGRAADWAATVAEDAEVAISGPARGYQADPEASDFVIGGDESAIPALTQIVASVADHQTVAVWCEITDPAARPTITDRPQATVNWLATPPDLAPGQALADVFTTVQLGPGTRVWAGGEAAAMQRIRRTLFEDRGMDRARVTVRGYWKLGRTASGPD